MTWWSEWTERIYWAVSLVTGQHQVVRPAVGLVEHLEAVNQCCALRMHSRAERWRLPRATDPRGLRDDAPLLDAWLRFQEQAPTAFTIPGHKHRTDLVATWSSGDALSTPD